LRAACQSSGTVELSASFDSTDFNSHQQIMISETVVINGNGAVLDAARARSSGMANFFWVKAGGSLTLDSLTLKNGYDSSGNGGAITMDGTTLVVRNCKFVSNSETKGYGGAILAYAGSTTITTTEFSGNACSGGQQVPCGDDIYNGGAGATVEFVGCNGQAYSMSSGGTLPVFPTCTPTPAPPTPPTPVPAGPTPAPSPGPTPPPTPCTAYDRNQHCFPNGKCQEGSQLAGCACACACTDGFAGDTCGAWAAWKVATTIVASMASVLGLAFTLQGFFKRRKFDQLTRNAGGRRGDSGGGMELVVNPSTGYMVEKKVETKLTSKEKTAMVRVTKQFVYETGPRPC
jgi:hypothetical protein